MASGGFRLGAWDYLQWKNVTPITNDNGEEDNFGIGSKLLSITEIQEFFQF